ncbi:hypothetical protein SSX86_003331 [Deinandra increscens subsp. villosa]|uniref:Replication factor A C-terminal domain-containing protein n=1 Tax=Deinandra increscens subsp. villosa TaxID=3103831 RepID=A0AAP0H801_9ASTR
MEQTKFTFISDLDVCKDDFILKLHVIRAWRKPMYNNAFVTHTIEMIMVDEQIIGIIVKCNPAVAWGKNPDNTDKIRINIVLQDIQGKRIWITLFEEYAEKMIQYLSNHKDESDVVIVLQFVKFAVYKGDHSITNAFRGTKLFINNEEVDEISSFKKSYIESHGHGSTSLFIGLSSVVSYSLEKDFLVHTEFNYIADLNVVSEVKKVVILGTIKCLQEGSKWFWYSCDTCNRMVDKKLNKEAIGTSGDLWTYVCNTKDCQNTTIKVTTRFKLLIKVQDSTGVCTLTLFDKEARKLLNSTATEMIRRYVEEAKEPSEIDNLFEKRFAMKFDVKEYNIDNDYRVFTISKVLKQVWHEKRGENEEKSKFGSTGQTQKSKSKSAEKLHGLQADFRSQDNSFNKEPIAVTDDVVSTVLLAADVSDKKSQTRPNSTNGNIVLDGPLKRKLTDVYGVKGADSSGPVEAVAEHGSADTMLAAAVPVVDLVVANGVELSHGDKVDGDGAENVKAHLVVVKKEK